MYGRQGAVPTELISGKNHWRLECSLHENLGGHNMTLLTVLTHVYYVYLILVIILHLQVLRKNFELHRNLRRCPLPEIDHHDYDPLHCFQCFIVALPESRTNNYQQDPAGGLHFSF